MRRLLRSLTCACLGLFLFSATPSKARADSDSKAKSDCHPPKKVTKKHINHRKSRAVKRITASRCPDGTLNADGKCASSEALEIDDQGKTRENTFTTTVQPPKATSEPPPAPTVSAVHDPETESGGTFDGFLKGIKWDDRSLTAILLGFAIAGGIAMAAYFAAPAVLGFGGAVGVTVGGGAILGLLFNLTK